MWVIILILCVFGFIYLFSIYANIIDKIFDHADNKSRELKEAKEHKKVSEKNRIVKNESTITIFNPKEIVLLGKKDLNLINILNHLLRLSPAVFLSVHNCVKNTDIYHKKEKIFKNETDTVMKDLFKNLDKDILWGYKKYREWLNYLPLKDQERIYEIIKDEYDKGLHNNEVEKILNKKSLSVLDCLTILPSWNNTSEGEIYWKMVFHKAQGNVNNEQDLVLDFLKTLNEQESNKIFEFTIELKGMRKTIGMFKK